MNTFLDTADAIPFSWVWIGLALYVVVLWAVFSARMPARIAIAPKAPDTWKLRARIVRACVCLCLVGLGWALVLGIHKVGVERDAVEVTPQKAAGVVVIDYSGSMEQSQKIIDAVVDRIGTQTGQHPVGYVIFADSSVAFTPVQEPNRFREGFFAAKKTTGPSTLLFAGGTNIISGVFQGEQMLERDGDIHAPLVLISDLNDFNGQWREYLSWLLDQGRPVRIIAIAPNQSDLVAVGNIAHNDFEIVVVNNEQDAQNVHIALRGDAGSVTLHTFTSGPSLRTFVSAGLMLLAVLATIACAPIVWPRTKGT